MKNIKSPSSFLYTRRIEKINEAIDNTNVKLYSGLYDDIYNILNGIYLERTMPNLLNIELNEKLNDEVLMYFYIQVMYIIKNGSNVNNQLESFINFFKGNYSYDILKQSDNSLITKYKLIYIYLINEKLGLEHEKFSMLESVLSNIVLCKEEEITRFISIIQFIRENYYSSSREIIGSISLIYEKLIDETSFKEANDFVLKIIEIYIPKNRRNLEKVMKEFARFTKNANFASLEKEENESKSLKFKIDVENEEVIQNTYVYDANVENENLDTYFTLIKDVYRTDSGSDLEKVVYFVNITAGLINIMLKVNVLIDEFRIDEFLSKLDYSDIELPQKLVLLENVSVDDDYNRDRDLVRYILKNFNDRYESLKRRVIDRKATEWVNRYITGTTTAVESVKLSYKK